MKPLSKIVEEREKEFDANYPPFIELGAPSPTFKGTLVRSHIVKLQKATALALIEGMEKWCQLADPENTVYRFLLTYLQEQKEIITKLK